VFLSVEPESKHRSIALRARTRNKSSHRNHDTFCIRVPNDVYTFLRFHTKDTAPYRPGVERKLNRGIAFVKGGESMFFPGIRPF
jgi:hypothetical protein